MDHNFSDRTKLAGYYQYWNNDQLSGSDGLPLPVTARRDQYIYSQIVRLNATHTLKPTVILTFGAGIQRLRNPDSSPASVLPLPSRSRRAMRSYCFVCSFKTSEAP
jgi:hypothetical protein